MADGAADDIVGISFVGNVGLEELFAGQPGTAISQGWEGLLLPGHQRRRVRMPTGFSLSPDISVVDRRKLLALQRRAETLLDTPALDVHDSMLVHRGDEVVGWVPIWRPASYTSVIRIVSIHPKIYADEQRRCTHLRLACFAQAVESQCSKGRSVLTWMSDTDDPVNELKVSVSGATTVTHWMLIRVRRDLRT